MSSSSAYLANGLAASLASSLFLASLSSLWTSPFPHSIFFISLSTLSRSSLALSAFSSLTSIRCPDASR